MLVELCFRLQSFIYYDPRLNVVPHVFCEESFAENMDVLLQDGFVLVGSVAGQRYWSSMLNDKATITCGIWTPDDQQV